MKLSYRGIPYDRNSNGTPFQAIENNCNHSLNLSYRGSTYQPQSNPQIASTLSHNFNYRGISYSPNKIESQQEVNQPENRGLFDFFKGQQNNTVFKSME